MNVVVVLERKVLYMLFKSLRDIKLKASVKIEIY